jgi:hypothetical protein
VKVGGLSNLRQKSLDRFFELIDKTPFLDEIEAYYDPSKEGIREQNYRNDLLLRRMKRCL